MSLEPFHQEKAPREKLIFESYAISPRTSHLRNIEARKNNKLATRYDRAAAIYNLLLNAVRRLSSNAKTKPQTKRTHGRHALTQRKDQIHTNHSRPPHRAEGSLPMFSDCYRISALRCLFAFCCSQIGH